MSIATMTTPTGQPLLDFEAKPGPFSAVMMILGAIAGGIGLVVVFYMLFTEGHTAFNTSSDMPWGAPIAVYLFFLLASSGLSILASLDTVFGLRTFYPVVKRCMWLAIVTLVAGFTVLALELGHPFRMLWAMPTALQVSSPMWWMGVLYSIDLVLLCVKFYMLHTGDWDSKATHRVSIVSFVISVLAAGTLGLVFGMMMMRPAWSGSVMPMYFILTGFMSAVATLVFFTSLLRRENSMSAKGEEHRRADEQLGYLYDVILPRLFFVTLLAVIATRFGQLLVGLWSNYEGMEAHWRAVKSPLFHIEIWVGFVLPAILMSTNALRASPQMQFISAVLFMIGIFSARLEFVVVGQEVPVFRGYWAGYVEYTPSFTEWMLVPVGVGISLFLYGAGDWLLRLSEGRVPKAVH